MKIDEEDGETSAGRRGGATGLGVAAPPGLAVRLGLNTPACHIGGVINVGKHFIWFFGFVK